MNELISFALIFLAGWLIIQLIFFPRSLFSLSVIKTDHSGLLAWRGSMRFILIMFITAYAVTVLYVFTYNLLSWMPDNWMGLQSEHTPRETISGLFSTLGGFGLVYGIAKGIGARVMVERLSQDNIQDP